jgi:hypothetical protein
MASPPPSVIRPILTGSPVVAVVLSGSSVGALVSAGSVSVDAGSSVDAVVDPVVSAVARGPSVDATSATEPTLSVESDEPSSLEHAASNTTSTVAPANRRRPGTEILTYFPLCRQPPHRMSSIAE